MVARAGRSGGGAGAKRPKAPAGGVGERWAGRARAVVHGAFDEVNPVPGPSRRCERAPGTYAWYMTEAREHDADVKSVEIEDVAGAGADGEFVSAESVPSAVEVAEAWLAQLVDQMAVPASDVQDHLLDLWGVLEEGPARSEIERWLTETLVRNLYSVSDINERLETVLPVP